MIAIRFKLSNHCRFLTYSCFFSVIPEGGNHAAKNVRGSLEHCLELRRLAPPERTRSMPAQHILKPVLVLVLVALDSLWLIPPCYQAISEICESSNPEPRNLTQRDQPFVR